MPDTHQCPACGRTLTLIPGWEGKKVKCPSCDTVSIAGEPLPAGPLGEVIRFRCEECDSTLQAIAARRGTKMICKTCGLQTTVPAEEPASAEDEDANMYRVSEVDESSDDPTAERCPYCEAPNRPEAIRCSACKRKLRKASVRKAAQYLGMTWTVWLSPFEWQRFTVETGKSGQPILVRERGSWLSSSPRTVVDLTKYHCLGLENEVPRERGVNWLALSLFAVTCGIIWLMLADTGSRTGTWVLRLNRHGEVDGMILCRNRNLARVHAIRDVLTAVSGLRVGRAY
jgi:hypothetical protein